MFDAIGFEGSWWRFDNYQIVGGTHIAPSPDAKLTWLDPYEEHSAHWRSLSRDEPDPPYVELANLDTSDSTKITDWCRRYGLLGAVFHEVMAVRLWPHWQVCWGDMSKRREMRLTATQRTFSMLPEVESRSVPLELFMDFDTEGDQFLFNAPAALRQPGQPLTDKELEEVWKGPDVVAGSDPGSQVRLHDGTLIESASVRRWATYFPRFPGVCELVDLTLTRPDLDDADLEYELERQDYPVPGDDDFLREYGEPLFIFRAFVEQLSKVHEAWSEEGVSASIASELLNSLGVYPRPKLLPKHEKETPPASVDWDYPSLFAALHLMMFEDILLGQGNLRTCRRCRRFFVTRMERKVYCSKKCRDSFHVAESRRRSKKAKPE